jgi:F-type H+-transporting ATPase subunit b
MRRGRIVGIALVVGLALFLRASSSQARQPHREGGPAAENAPAAHEGAEGPRSAADKMFKPAEGSRLLDLSLWTIVVFLILLWVLGKYAWGPMLKGLEAREHTIHSAVEEAHKAREETARLRDEVVQERAKAAEEARATIEQARRDAQKQADELRTKAVAEIQAERDRLRRDLELARDSALQELWAQTARLATLVSSRAIGRELNPDDHRKLADEAIADLRRAGAERQREVAGV